VTAPRPARGDGPRILLIEDEVGIADFVARGLEAYGYRVESVFDGIEGERRALGPGVDLVILDRMLPGRDGLHVLAAIRRHKAELPVLLLTARTEIDDRVAGLDAGATDYLTKPFALAELAARVRAHLREARPSETTTLSAAGIDVDLLARKVRRNGRELALTAKEFDLLAYFLRHPGLTVSRREILAAVWGYQHDPQTNIVEVYVRYLRRKLEQPGLPAPIETVRSIGYRLTDPRR
jgi:DNA-binding response OmpR family regulator